MNKKLIGSIVLGVILVTSIAFILLGRKDKPNIGIKPVVANPVVKPTEGIIPPAVVEDVKEVIDIREAIDMAHSMANTLIEADDIIGLLPMNKENVVELLELLYTIEDSANKTTLIQIAQKWELSDFIIIDDDHDVILGMIPKANIGKSTGINKDEVIKAVLNME